MRPRDHIDGAGTLALLAAIALTGCAASRTPSAPAEDPDAVRARISSLLPPGIASASGWAVDIFAAFEALKLAPSTQNLCAVVAVTEQETGFRVDPPIPGLARIARREMTARAASHGIPALVLNAALALRGSDGRSYSSRLDAVTTERQLSELFEDFIDRVPLGKRLFADLNPVRTAGPMQVSIAFAQRQVEARPYPFPQDGDLRQAVFSRRGGLYFGIAHLLDYPAPYDRMLFRFADFNAGHYASRNAAFQAALSGVSGTRLVPDGDLLLRGGSVTEPSRTELALRGLGERLGAGARRIRADLELGNSEAFASTQVYERVMTLADAMRGTPVTRALIPTIRLQSPKITRQLTTEWFARRVEERFQRCQARAR